MKRIKKNFFFNLLHFKKIRKSLLLSQGESSALTTDHCQRSTAARAKQWPAVRPTPAPEAEG